ncbi:MAG: hypothetical protein JKY65_09820 [Planctomycetes bacterium]|nr:hypothetical protein [Planctomycetota bacterium]
MADDEKKAAGGGKLPKILVVLLLPFAAFGVYKMMPVAEAIKQEIGSGADFDSLKAKFKEGGFDAVQEMLKASPELSAGLILERAVRNDEQLLAAVRGAAPRLNKSGALTTLELRFLLRHLPSEVGQAPDASTDK